MDEEKFNITVRKFLKVVGVSSQRELEKVVWDAVRSGRLHGTENLPAKVTLEVPALNLVHVIDGTIELG
jgi:hypothetical protein